jgi:hypothetical protein
VRRVRTLRLQPCPLDAAHRRPGQIAPGDVVVTSSEELGEWTAAQIVALDPERELADVLDLDWSGPEPSAIEELGGLKPLRLTHHEAWGQLAQMNREWVLPRSHRVIGSAPLLVTQRSKSYRRGWNTGLQLHLQRRWDAGDREDELSESVQRWDGALLNFQLAAESSTGFPDVRRLVVDDVRELDCADLVAAFPNLTSLALWGVLGCLENARDLNRLKGLRTLNMFEVFGLSAEDHLDPSRMPILEYIDLESVPAEFATAMRRVWAPEVGSGVYLSITGARSAAWLEDNLNNPLRIWDGRENFPPLAYKRAIAAWTKTTTPIRKAMLDPILGPALLDRLATLGAEFARAFDKVRGRTHLIETQERDELLEALHQLITHAPAVAGVDREQAAATALHAVNQERSW